MNAHEMWFEFGSEGVPAAFSSALAAAGLEAQTLSEVPWGDEAGLR
jgi:hypothetical protein